MTAKRITRSIISAMVLILTLVIIAAFVSFAVRFFLFLNWENLFSEWCDLMDELDIHTDDELGYQTPFKYHMVAINEVYLLKTYRLYDETGKITEDELRKRYQKIVDEANERLDGNETRLYIGHEVPYFADTTLIWIKPINWIRSIFVPEREIDESFWFVAVYKKARSPFCM